MSFKQKFVELRDDLLSRAKTSLIKSNDLTRPEGERQRLKGKADAFLEVVEILEKMFLRS